MKLLETFGLSFIPKRIHLFKSHVLELAALVDGGFLYVVEAAYEFLVGALKCVIGMDLVEACYVDD